MNKIKILFVHHGTGWGGAPISMLNVLNQLDKSQFEPHVLLLKDSIVKDRLAENNIAYTVCSSIFYKKWNRYLTHSDAGYIKPFKIFRILKMFISWYLSKYIFAPKVLKKHTYDVVHLNSSVLSDWVYPASRMGKVIYHVREPISRGTFGWRYKFIRSEIEKYADKVIAISKDNAKRINLPEKTVVIYNFITIPDKIENNNFAKSVLYVGGSSKIKGIEVLLDAIPYIDNDIQLNLAGSFPKLNPLGTLKRIVYRLCFPVTFRLRSKLEVITNFKNINIIGSVSTIDKILKESTLLISPFTVPHFSRPVVEAFSYGKPVIASDVLGMDEIVNNGVDGILFKNGDAKALAQAINTLVNNKKLVHKMGLNGRQKSIDTFSPKENVLKIELVYKNLTI